MEEKDYKKLYENVVSMAKEGLKDGLYLSRSAKDVTEFLFPQLKETEDEKVKRELTTFLINFNNGAYSRPSEDKIDSWIKWIDKKCEQNCQKDNEKQGEQKSIDMIEPKFKLGDKIVEKDLNECGSGTIKEIRDGKYIFEDNCFIYIKEQDLWQLVKEPVEPKFKIGDWVVNKIGHVWNINSFDKKNYQVSNGDKYNYFPISKQNEMRLWTIQDAEDGDVLVCIGKYGQEIGVVKKYVGKYGGCDKCFETYCFVDWDGIFRTGEYMGSKEIHPATKEQRGLLFTKMHKDGYEWDAENKKLIEIKKKCEQNEQNFWEKCNSCEYFDGYDICLHKKNFGTVTDGTKEKCKNNGFFIEKQVEKKPADKVKTYCQENCKGYRDTGGKCFADGECEAKKKAEQKHAWSEEDENMLEDTISCLSAYKSPDISKGLCYKEQIDWLKSLKNRVQPQPKQEWSEEDEKIHTIKVFYPSTGIGIKEAIEKGIAHSKKEGNMLISINGIFLLITQSSTVEKVMEEYNNCVGNNSNIKEKVNPLTQWTTDDESYLKGVICDIECEVLCANCSRNIADMKINWLKSLKEKIHPNKE